MLKHFKKGIAFACIILALVLPNASVFAYTNPLTLPSEWASYGTGDPYVMKYNGVFYLYASTANGQTGVKCWSSTDTVNWTYAGMCSTDPITYGSLCA